MRIHIVSLFPEVFGSYLTTSIPGRAQECRALSVEYYNLANYSIRPTKRVDRHPYGGFPGMVIEPEPLANALEEIDQNAQKTLPKILLSPRGELLAQERLESMSQNVSEFVLICGHYEGVDQRVIEHFNIQELSIGEYVLSSGEIAAMVLVDGLARLLPWVISPESLHEESFSKTLDRKKEYPHYTRPEVWRGHKVPEILLSWDPKKIEAWKQSFF